MASASWSASAAAVLAAVCLLTACDKGAPPAPEPAELAELDRAVGLMGRFEFAAARDVFARLAARHPRWFEARFNEAIAALNRQAEGDEHAAGQALRALQRESPDDARVLYTLGLIALRGEPPKNAESLLRKVHEQDPQDAYAAYFLGQAVLAQARAEEALRLFERAAALDRLLRSAHYGAAQALARLGREREAEARMAEFQRYAGNPLSRLAEFKYTRMGPKSEALPASRGPLPKAAPAGPLFAAAVKIAEARRQAGRPVPSAADIDGDGQIDLLVPGGRGEPSRILLRRGPHFVAQAGHPLARPTGVEFAAWGDFDNDGLTDVLLCRADQPPILVLNKGSGSWQPLAVPALARLHGARDCAVLDVDHDGDLDVVIVTADGGRQLVANNGNGTFRSLTDRLPAAPKRNAIQLVAGDFDNDRTVDLVFLHAEATQQVLRNELLWNWRPAPGFAGMTLAAAAADLEASGEMEIVALTPQLALQRWKRHRDGSWRAHEIAARSGAIKIPTRAQLALADLDGDGVAEILASSGRGVAAWALSGEQRWELEDPSVLGWTLVTLDEAGPSLITVHADGSVALHAPGPGRAQFVRVAFAGRHDPSTSIRSNASGIGVRVAARVAGRWVANDTLRRHSGPGQNLEPLAIGVGSASVIDYLRIDWSDGTFQTETALGGREVLRIAELQRQLSSCPLLFAWDGERYAFVSDFLGVGGLGYLVAPGEYAPPRPWENFLFPAGLLAPKAGRYVVKVAEPMEEAAYIDALKLLVHDLPPGWDMALDERMQIGPPKVTGEPFYFRRVLLPSRVVNDRGEDVTAALRNADRRAADPGRIDRRFIGRLAGEHVLTLEFSEALDGGRGPAVLVADGWIEYPYSQTMFGAWQAGADYRAPTLEGRGGDGRWRVLLKEFGYPAGMPRTMAVTLPKLPRGTRALRLRTNQQIYWDRIAIASAEDAPVVKRSLHPVKAEVAASGFPRRLTGAQHLPDYHYAERGPLWDTRTQVGLYTDFGPAAELVAARDGALAIIGPGEEIHVEFPADLPPLAAGWTRRFVLEAHGWAKDMDLYTRHRDTLEPLPAGAGHELNRRFNRRPGG